MSGSPRDVAIPGVVVSRRQAHEDERGRFAELFRATEFAETFVQSNHSRSRKNVLRGLHYHCHQADLWYVVAGLIRVGLGDLRVRTERPATACITLSGEDPTTLYIPAGVAHGFLALEDSDLLYFVTNEYDGSDERGIAWNDPTFAIPWGVDDPLLSDRDVRNPPLQWRQIPAFS